MYLDIITLLRHNAIATTLQCDHNFYTQQETKKFFWLALWRYWLYWGGLEPNTQSLWGMPVYDSPPIHSNCMEFASTLLGKKLQREGGLEYTVLSVKIGLAIQARSGEGLAGASQGKLLFSEMHCQCLPLWVARKGTVSSEILSWKFGVVEWEGLQLWGQAHSV